ncbi:MAG: HAD family hydrolase [Propionibacteriaceae bacterium]
MSETVALSPVEPAHVPLAIFFDGDGTLWDFQTIMLKGMYAARELLAARTGVVTSIEAMLEDRDVAATALAGKTITLSDIRRQGFATTAHRLGVYSAALVEELTATFFAARDQETGLYDDTCEALARLGAQVPLGYLSNGNSHPHQRGLAEVFSVVIMAEDVGVAKPSPDIFAAAEAALPAERYILVGDSLADDVEGANAAGWTSILVDREGRYAEIPEMSAQPHYRTTSLLGVVDLVGE